MLTHATEMVRRCFQIAAMAVLSLAGGLAIAARADAAILLKDSFGFAPVTAQGGTRYDAAGNIVRVTVGSDLSGLRAEYPFTSSEVWSVPGGHGVPTWHFSVSSPDPCEQYGTPSEPTPADNGTMSLIVFPADPPPPGKTDALLNFTPPAGPYQMSLDVVAGGDTTAIGFTSSRTTLYDNFQSFGQVWMVLHGGAGEGGIGTWELHTNGLFGPSVSGTTLLQGYNPLAISYDPATHTVIGSVNGVLTPALSYTAGGIAAVGFEGVWTVNNFVVRTGTILPGWTGNGGDGNARWDVAANWSGEVVPADVDVSFGASFNNGTTIDLNGNRSIRSMIFTNNSNATFVNGTLGLTGITKRAGLGSVSFDLTTTVNVAAGATIENNGSGGRINFNGDVSLQGPGVTLTGARPIAIGGTLNDNGNGLTNNGSFLAFGVVSAASIDGAGSITVQPGGQLNAGHVRQAQLAVGDGATATMVASAQPNDPGRTSRLGALNIDGGALPTGTLDLGNNSLVIDYTAGQLGTKLSDVTAQIGSGRNGKDANDQAKWNGNGIITTAGRAANVAARVDRFNLGAINNADLDLAGIGPHLTTFAGQAVAPNTVLVKYGYSGDANLNGVVDGDDYTYWLNGFLGTTNPAVQGWLRGDFDYNGVIDGDDYTQWLNSFLFAGPPLAGGEPSPVPEPTALLLLGAAAAGLAPFYRRR